jgi:SAM-dependent methyltransferase
MITDKDVGKRMTEDALVALRSAMWNRQRQEDNSLLVSKPCTQKDMESWWCQHWMMELRDCWRYHRKCWELAYVCEALHQAGKIFPGARGIGFGCGKERLPSYFTSQGCKILATDLWAPNDVWESTNQRTSSQKDLWHEGIVSWYAFEQGCAFDNVDMNNIPDHLRQGEYDFCWSVCALEHLGSSEAGKQFVINSMDCLKPGGVAVHTTEYTVDPSDHDVDIVSTVFYSKPSIEDLIRKLNDKGYRSDAIFDTGDKPLDHYADPPPYGIESENVAHLKVGYPDCICTCYGLIVNK